MCRFDESHGAHRLVRTSSPNDQWQIIVHEEKWILVRDRRYNLQFYSDRGTNNEQLLN